MSQANENTGSSATTAAIDQKEFEKALLRSEEEKRRRGLRGGPRYNECEADPLVWHDQAFERELTPAGIVLCSTALRVGSTQNGLDLLLVGSNANTGPVQAASGATVTLITLQADEPDGDFEAVGASHCLTAPTEGISAEPNALLCRIPLGNFRKPWLKARLEFSGTITGGLLDAVLSYAAR